MIRDNRARPPRRESTRQASARRGSDSAGRTLGNEGLAVCLRTDRPEFHNYTKCVRCPSLGVKHPAACPDGAKCGGLSPVRLKHGHESKPPRGGALVGGRPTNG